jgi:hypothetical protein
MTSAFYRSEATLIFQLSTLNSQLQREVFRKTAVYRIPLPHKYSTKRLFIEYFAKKKFFFKQKVIKALKYP